MEAVACNHLCFGSNENTRKSYGKFEVLTALDPEFSLVSILENVSGTLQKSGNSRIRRNGRVK